MHFFLFLFFSFLFSFFFKPSNVYYGCRQNILVLTILPKISHTQKKKKKKKNPKFKSKVGKKYSNCLYSFNLMVGTCEESVLFFFSVISS